MRFHNNNSYVPDGDLNARMNPAGDGESAFGVIDLGGSQFCLDTAEDARRLLDAAARIVTWFQVPPVRHAFESVHGTRAAYGPCAHCGHIKSDGRHLAPAPAVRAAESEQVTA